MRYVVDKAGDSRIAAKEKQKGKKIATGKGEGGKGMAKDKNTVIICWFILGKLPALHKSYYGVNLCPMYRLVVAWYSHTKSSIAFIHHYAHLSK
jgi:hypothetical protein